MRRAFAVMGLAVLVVGCRKAPSAAVAAAESYATLAAKRWAAEVSKLTVDGAAPSISLNGGQPEAGALESCSETVGQVEWAKTKPVAEQKLPDGDVVVELLVDICSRPENSLGGCMRPNTYTLRALMHREDEAWKVAGSTCETKSIVR